MTNSLPTNNTLDEKAINLIRTTIAPTASAEEFGMFIEYCKSTGLNPFKKEIWFIKTPGYRKKDGTTAPARVQIMTGINGYMTIANRHPMFDGMECTVEYKEKGDSKYIIGATAKVYRKDRRFPSVATALWNEYYKPNPYGNKGVWEQMPSIMIAKCAKSLALREAFPQELNGLYTEEEMPASHSAPRLEGLYDTATGKLEIVERKPVESKEVAPVVEKAVEDFKFEEDDLPWDTTPTKSKRGL